MEHGQHGVNGFNVLSLVILVFKLEIEHVPIQYLSTMVLHVSEIAQLSDPASVYSVQV